MPAVSRESATTSTSSVRLPTPVLSVLTMRTMPCSRNSATRLVMVILLKPVRRCKSSLEMAPCIHASLKTRALL